MIRQAISCDICGRDKQQTNHWFVAHEHGSELRISGWNSQVRMSAKAKHLCGQTCMHKLVDDFMARTIAARHEAAEEAVPAKPTTAAVGTDTSLTLARARTLPMRGSTPIVSAYTDEYDSSARLSSPASPVRREDIAAPMPSLPAYNTRAWRTEAWRREQERGKQNAQKGKSFLRSSVQ